MTVTALIDNVICGETTITTIDGQLAYLLPVAAADSADETASCGVAGKAVTFKVGDNVMAHNVAWNNAQATFWSLGETMAPNADLPHRTYLPLINR